MSTNPQLHVLTFFGHISRSWRCQKFKLQLIGQVESSKPFILTKDEKQPMDYNYEWDSEHEHALHYLISLSITDVGPGTIATMLQ